MPQQWCSASIMKVYCGDVFLHNSGWYRPQGFVSFLPQQETDETVLTRSSATVATQREPALFYSCNWA